ncbi:MAG: SDR family NAD(P)-dependent oxidoreductase [Rhodospirillales bacterium]|nr:SDR family NAD(P)-dependent oxidoreductase [Acetobacter sp.]
MSESSPSQAKKTWFITGASRGFGRALAEVALRHGDRVFGTVRGGRSHGLDPLPGLEIVKLDVTDPAAVKRAIDDTWQKAGQVDILVNNAGYGVLGAIEEVSEEDIRQVFETNVFGLMAVTRAALPHLRKQRSGHLLNLSSVGGLVGIAGYGFYNATKFAVEGFSEALSYELAPLGIHVTIVEPGPYRTDFLEGSSLKTSASHIADYEPSVGATRKAADERRGKQVGDPVRAAELIYRVTLEEKPPLRLVLGKPAIDLARKKFAQVEADIAAWEQPSVDTAYPG